MNPFPVNEEMTNKQKRLFVWHNLSEFEKNSRMFILSGIFIFLFLASISFYGPRGSDQFWYMQEIENLVKNNAITSNFYYSGMYWREAFNEHNNYFIHHSLVHYLVYPLAYIFGSFAGWFFTSIISIIIGTLLLVNTTYNITRSHKIASLAGLFFLFLPCTVWQSFNILQESIMCSYMCLCVWLWERSLNVSKEKKIFYDILGGLAGAIGVLIHPLFTVWCIGWIIKLLFERGFVFSCRLWVPVISTFLSLLTIQYLKKNIFPTKFMPSIATIISNTSMTYFFDYVLNDVTLNVILCKFINAIKNQFAFSGTAIFFYPFNILLGFFLFSVFYTYKKNKLADLRPFIIPMFILIGFLGVIILHQNQFRYNLIITPLILVSTIFGLYKTNLHSAICKKPFLYSLIMILAFLVFIDFNLARHIYKDSYRYAITTDNHKKILPDNSRNQKVLFIFKGDDYLSYGWALYPRKILFLPLAKMSAPESYEVVQKFKPQIVLVQGMLDEDIEKVLPLKVAKLSSNPDELYKVVD